MDIAKERAELDEKERQAIALLNQIAGARQLLEKLDAETAAPLPNGHDRDAPSPVHGTGD